MEQRNGLFPIEEGGLGEGHYNAVVQLALGGSVPKSDFAQKNTGPNQLFGVVVSDGTYSFDLKNGTYTVTGWYTRFDGTTPSVTRIDQSGVTVHPRQVTPLDFSG